MLRVLEGGRCPERHRRMSTGTKEGEAGGSEPVFRVQSAGEEGVIHAL